MMNAPTPHNARSNLSKMSQTTNDLCFGLNRMHSSRQWKIVKLQKSEIVQSCGMPSSDGGQAIQKRMSCGHVYILVHPHIAKIKLIQIKSPLRCGANRLQHLSMQKQKSFPWKVLNFMQFFAVHKHCKSRLKLKI